MLQKYGLHVEKVFRVSNWSDSVDPSLTSRSPNACYPCQLRILGETYMFIENTKGHIIKWNILNILFFVFKIVIMIFVFLW